jgi:hypothetical protein
MGFYDSAASACLVANAICQVLLVLCRLTL